MHVDETEEIKRLYEEIEEEEEKEGLIEEQETRKSINKEFKTFADNIKIRVSVIYLQGLNEIYKLFIFIFTFIYF